MALKPPINAEKLSELFTSTLHWNEPTLQQFQLTVSVFSAQPILFQPIAQIGGLHTFCIELNSAKSPNESQFIAIYREAKKNLGDCLLIYVIDNGKNIILSWTVPVTTTRDELRLSSSCPEKNNLSIVNTLAELVFDLTEIEAGDPHISHIIERINTAFTTSADIPKAFERLLRQMRILKEQYLDLADIAHKNMDYKRFNKLTDNAEAINNIHNKLKGLLEQWNKQVK